MEIFLVRLFAAWGIVLFCYNSNLFETKMGLNQIAELSHIIWKKHIWVKECCPPHNNYQENICEKHIQLHQTGWKAENNWIQSNLPAIILVVFLINRYF